MPSRRELANAVRALSMDAVQKAKSGHPGAAKALEEMEKRHLSRQQSEHAGEVLPLPGRPPSRS